MGGGILVAAGVDVEMLLGQLAGRRLMAGLGGGQIAQQLAGGGVGGAGSGGEIEALGVALHHLGLLADPLDPEILDQPDRAPVVVARHMLAPDQRDGRAEPRLVQRRSAGARCSSSSAAMPSNSLALDG